MKKIRLTIAIIFASVICKSQWTQVNNGLTANYVTSIINVGTNLFAGTNFGIFLSTDNGNSWTATNTGLTNTNVLLLGTEGTNIFASTIGMSLSTNNGSNWLPINTGLTNDTVISLAISGNKIFAGTYKGVFLSTNNGSTWTAAGLTGINIASLATDGVNTFAGTSGGVYLSANDGGSWAPVNAGLTIASRIQSLGIFGTTVFAGNSTGFLFTSSNNGNNWAAASNGLIAIGSPIFSFAKSGTSIFAGGGTGVFLSTNNGNNWITVDSGLTDMHVQQLAINGTDLFAATYGGGIFRRPLSEMTSISEITNPESLTLYPNPATTSFTIESTNKIQSIKVVDIIGNEILSFDKLRMTQSETVDVSGIAKGIYFVQITVDSAGSPTNKNVINKKIVVQ